MCGCGASAAGSWCSHRLQGQRRTHRGTGGLTCQGYTPLHKALRKSAAESVVRLLLDRGASAMARALNGDTPLHIAAKSKKQGSAVANVAMLLDHHGMHARVASNG
eukprot:m.169936 g.169936  ORF g.169936 m.169936 type:complete len:106 (+) comp9925_c0_seq43:1340-1657(+)